MERAALVLLVAILVPMAAAQENLIELETDKDTYRAGDFLVVYGSVSTILPGEEMRMQILFEGNVVEIAQFDVAGDGTYTHVVRTDGANWSQDGLYSLRVWYGTQDAGKAFDFIAGDLDQPTGVFEVADGRGDTFDVDYAVRGATIGDMRVDYGNLAIIVDIESQEGGTLLVDLPRRYINATDMDGADVQFIVLVDGAPVEHRGDGGTDARRVLADFPEGAQEIMIIGTSVVPEFGLVMVVMAAGVAAAALARFRSGTFL